MDFDEVYGASEGLYYPHVSPWVASLASEITAGRALDLGCGDGRNTLHLLLHGWTVDAVDIAPTGLSKLEVHACQSGNRAKVATFAEEAHEFLATRHGLYDLVIASTLLDHVPSEIAQAVAEAIWRALVTGGVMYASVFLEGDPCLSDDGAGGPTAFGVRRLFASNELPALFPNAVVERYAESVEEDRTHGAPHWHSIARLVARKASG